jgi:Co/Zn/Cd efflux system component
LANVLTSISAIIALTLGKHFGWYRLDSFMGIIGAILITRWSYGLLKDTMKDGERRWFGTLLGNLSSDICKEKEDEQFTSIADGMWGRRNHMDIHLCSLCNLGIIAMGKF